MFYPKMWFLVLLLTVCFILGHNAGDKTPVKPKFPDTFTVEIEAVFVNEEAEADITLYYDRPNNRAVFEMLYQGEETKQIFLFDDNEMLTITGKGTHCEVDKIPDNSNEIFFPFVMDDIAKKKNISLPEHVLFFENSEYATEELDDFFKEPLFVYDGTVNRFGRNNCKVTHMFTKPEFSTATCSLRRCIPVLQKATLTCLNSDDETVEIYHRYKFFRFRAEIDDTEVFQPAVGTFCKRSQIKEFPTLPKDFSFSYDVFQRQMDIPTIAKGQFVKHRAVLYDSNIKVIRIDDYEEDGHLTAKKVYDFVRGVMYETLPGIQDCTKGPIVDISSLEQITNLPEIIFPWTIESNNQYTTYVGQRIIQGIQYEVWSSQMVTENKEFKKIQDLFYIKKYGEGTDTENYKLKLAFVKQYEYESDGLSTFQLQRARFSVLNHFLASFRNWRALDVSDCFTDEEKMVFEIEIASSEKSSSDQFENTLFIKLVSSSGVSVLRIGKLKMVLQLGTKTSFAGTIIDNLRNNTSLFSNGKNKREPTVKEAFNNLKRDVDAGTFSFNLTVNGKELNFIATYFGAPRKDLGSDGYTGGAMAALGVVMAGIGAVIGGIAIFLYAKVMQRKPN